MSQLKLNRREMLQAGGGLIIVGGLLTSPGFAQEESKDLIFRTTDPRNGEPELGKLVQSWITPTKHFYVRSHAPNPKINKDEFRLQVEGLVRRPMSLALGEVKRFGARTTCLLYTSPSPRDLSTSRMPSSA